MAGSRIVVVEDEQIVSKDIQVRLKKFGYEIAGAAASGEDAIELVGDTRPDLVMMDVMLKGHMLGTEAADIIRKKYDVPVIYLTAYADESTLNQAKITEPYGYVLKPFDERELKTTIEMALYKHRAEKEKQKLKEQLFQSQKLEAIGHLTTGVAHNFNNALNVVMGNLELIRMQTGDDIAPFLKRAQDASDTAARIVDGLLAFCRERQMKKEVFDVRGAINAAADMCQQLLKGEIALDIQVPRTALWVDGDDNHIQQVILNLCLNARDACDELPDSTRNPLITLHLGQVTRDGQSYACVTVADNGAGMSEEVQQSMFEPFFTTKPVDRGTGLGLATAYGIVQDHAGWIDCLSEVNVGTTFEVYLPLKEGYNKEIDDGVETAHADSLDLQTKTPVSKEKQYVERKRQNKTILIVEDEEIVRVTERELLKFEGYDVLEADSGEIGWELFLEKKDTIDLVITDLSMPGISGRELLERILNLDAQTRVVVVTGNPPDEVVAPGAKAVLGKPLHANIMYDTVRRVLDA